MPTVVNVLLTFVPTVVIAAIETTAMSEARIAYSIIVAPSVSLCKRRNILIIDIFFLPVIEKTYQKAAILISGYISINQT